jgi:hypothetical protein
MPLRSRVTDMNRLPGMNRLYWRRRSATSPEPSSPRTGPKRSAGSCLQRSAGLTSVSKPRGGAYIPSRAQQLLSPT